MPVAKTDLWSSVLEDIEKEVGEQRFSLWFRNVRPVRMEAGEILLGVPNLFVQEWLETHFLGALRQKLSQHLDRTPTVKFVIDPQLFQQARETALQANAAIVEEAAAPAPKESKVETHLRPDFTLDSFILGANNKLAHACAVEIIESRANRLNPLFIHSLSGLGKTHLMQAVLHEVHRRNDGRKAEYLSAETFTNQFIYAMRSNRLDAFRHRYRNVDILLIDDVHFISNKSGLQEELLHTYEALNTGNKQLVLASDVHPKMLSKVKQNLVNRFASGMVVRMGQPDFATRVAILKAKLQQQGRRMPEDVVRYVARGFEGSVRELSGAVTLIQAYASLTGEKVDVALARTALSRLSVPDSGNSSLDGIEKVVARHYGLKVEAMRGRRVTRIMRLPRQLSMYLARRCTPMSCREIARHFGSANHGTVLFAITRIEQSIAKDANFAELVASMEKEVRRR